MSGAYYNEIDPLAASWLRNLVAAGHLPAGDVDERSIVDVAPSDLAGYDQCHFFAGIGGWPYALRLAGWPDDEPAWTGSCPCQPFSVAGKGLGTADKRHLWPEFLRLIAERHPSIVLGEQVASAAGRLWLAGVRADLEALGYAVGAADLCAASVGAPHIRQRLYWVADAQHAERRTEHQAHGDAHGWHRPRRGGTTSGLADADGYRQRPGSGRVREQEERDDARRGSAAGRLANATGGGFGADGRAPGQPGHADSCGTSRGMGEPIVAGLEGLAGDGDDGNEPGRFDEDEDRPAASPGCSGLGEWADADFINCGDGRSRRIPLEPEFFPLAHGVPARVGRLRAYGNAIVPPLAAEFIAAYREASGR